MWAKRLAWAALLGSAAVLSGGCQCCDWCRDWCSDKPAVPGSDKNSLPPRTSGSVAPQTTGSLPAQTTSTSAPRIDPYDGERPNSTEGRAGVPTGAYGGTGK